MEYYKQGDAANADQIKAAFEKLGIASNADRYNYKNDNVLYFTAGGMIHMIDANGAWANIIKTHPDYKELELPKPHYDIANFKPFDKVLVRDRNNEPWRIAFYGYYNEEANYSHLVGTCWSKQCIPYNDDTKHLLGTTEMPSEEYINW